ncbi:MAG: CMP deaminase [Proteobacteria bacterium]|nr:CMP deaminase [Pseudomonadota bacterium]NBP15375.1 CMP deaminase [bacterium]
MSTQNWDHRFLVLAKLIGSWSKDPSTQVGAVIVDENNRIVSVGYNGFPQNIKDDDRLYDRETKYKIIVHGEINAILFANRSIIGCTLYTFPFEPCPRCAGLIIQSGIKRVVSLTNNIDRWEEDFNVTRQLFKEANIAMDYYDGV